ncbi:MAG: TonB-dependent receptor [Flavobacteriales bacterium]|nr:MAG: TonB-dependent receptor [Flavobacteriales bacterium]
MKKLFIGCMALFSVHLSIAQEQKQDTILTEELNEVVVRAVRVNATSPITHSNITQKEISKRNLGQDMPILLNYLPGVVTTSDAGAGIGYTGIRVRGSDADRVNVTINGIPYNDSESHTTFWVNLPDFASSTESLQLQRGVGTSVNGAGAFGASLNILTDAVSHNAYAEIGSSFGSYNTKKHHVKFSTGLINDFIEVSGRLSKISSDGYIDRASSDLKSYFLQAAYRDRNTLIKALTFGGKEITYQAWGGITKEQLEEDRKYNPSGLYYDDDGNEKFYDNEIDNYQQDHYQLHWSERYNNRWSSNIGLNYTRGKGYYEQYKEDEGFEEYQLEPITIGNETIDKTDIIRRRWLDNHFYVATANVNYKNEQLDLIFGGTYSYYTNDHYGEIIWAQYASNAEIRDRYYESNGNKKESNLFAKATYKLNNNWSLFADVQGRFIHYKTDGITSDLVPLKVNTQFNFFNPKVGITYVANHKNQLYLSYAKAQREPRRNDFENNIDTAEKLHDIELGWRFDTDKIKLNTNVYGMFYKDQLVLTGQIDDVGAPVRTNSGKSYRVGLEVDALVELGKKLVWQPNIALSSSKNIDFVTEINGEIKNLGETDISYSPNIVASNVLAYSPVKNLQITLLSKYVGEQFMSNTESPVSKLDDYFVSDFNIQYQWQPSKIFESITITGLVNNIFNKKYVSNGYYYTYNDTWSNPGSITTIEGTGYYPQATTNFLVGTVLRF